MPIPASPYSAVPQFLSRPATPPMVGGPGTMGPPGAPVAQPQGGPTVSMPPGGAGAIGGPGGPGGPGGREPDIVERLVMLMMQTPQFFIPWMAGLGFQRLLEKSGKFSEKPHRSNEELSGQGYPVGIPGQTGQPSPEQMQRQLQPPGLQGLGGMVGF